MTGVITNERWREVQTVDTNPKRDPAAFQEEPHQLAGRRSPSQVQIFAAEARDVGKNRRHSQRSRQRRNKNTVRNQPLDLNTWRCRFVNANSRVNVSGEFPRKTLHKDTDQILFRTPFSSANRFECSRCGNEWAIAKLTTLELTYQPGNLPSRRMQTAIFCYPLGYIVRFSSQSRARSLSEI